MYLVRISQKNILRKDGITNPSLIVKKLKNVSIIIIIFLAANPI